ncbi:MAG: hypothetical protein M0P71_12005 [Melioribacteraceae bacterium]|jgi:hypothetical protein|nr:hypothetical protein [Melioribacteraceae bacterium]
MTLRDHIDNWLTEAKTDLAANYNKLGLRASGQWERDLETNIEERPTGYTAEILGSAYTGVLESGRKPNTNKNPESIRAWVGWAGSTFLKEWVQRKGIQANPFAVAWKIARKGITVPNRFNAGGLVSDVITEERIQKLLEGISLVMITEVRSDVLKTLKEK